MKQKSSNAPVQKDNNKIDLYMIKKMTRGKRPITHQVNQIISTPLIHQQQHTAANIISKEHSTEEHVFAS